jgi:hypothetical protein
LARPDAVDEIGLSTDQRLVTVQRNGKAEPVASGRHGIDKLLQKRTRMGIEQERGPQVLLR